MAITDPAKSLHATTRDGMVAPAQAPRATGQSMGSAATSDASFALWFCPSSLPGRGAAAIKRDFANESLGREYVRGVNAVRGFEEEFEIMRHEPRLIEVRHGYDGDRSTFRFESPEHRDAFIRGLADAQGLDNPAVYWPWDAEFAQLEAAQGAQAPRGPV